MQDIPLEARDTQTKDEEETVNKAAAVRLNRTESSLSRLSAETDRTDFAKETAEKADILQLWKDRAQIAAASALSLCLVTLLKELIVRGPDTFRYYYVCLSLVSVCLTLQVVVGLLAIVMYQLQGRRRAIDDVITTERQRLVESMDPESALANFDLFDADLEQHRSIVMEDFQKKRWQHAQNVAFTTENDISGINDITENADLDLQDGDSPHAATSGVANGNENTTKKTLTRYSARDGKDKNGREWSCVHTKSGTKCFYVEPDWYKILNDLKHKEMKVLLAVVEADGRGRRSSIGSASSRENADRLLNELRIIRQKQKLILLKAESVQKRRIVKHITNLQNTITYLFYIIFVLNTFITGFGVSG